MNVVVVAPHPDDEAIGCGGTLRLHIERGDRVVVVFLTSGELGLKHLAAEEAWQTREAEARAAAEVLGITELRFLRLADWHVGDAISTGASALHPVLEQEEPALIYLPHPAESHPDHRATLTIVRAALAARRSGSRGHTPVILRGFEVWTPLTTFDFVRDISRVFPVKLRAVRCYRSQLASFRYDRAVRGLSQYRGALVTKTRCAEVFQTLDVAGPTSEP